MADETVVGAGSPSATYLGNRLLYGMGDETLDPLMSGRYLLALLLRSVFFAVIWAVGAFLLFNVTLILGAATGDGNAAAVVVGLGLLLNLVWTVGLFIAYWVLPIPALVSEWKLTVDGRSDSQQDALDHVAFAIEEKRAPIGTVTAQQLSVSGQPDRTCLQVREGYYSAYVSCFAFGHDLYMGWTFWLYLSPLRWFLLWWSRLFRSLRPTSPIVTVNKTLDTARAMREVVHSAVREGVDVAVTGRFDPAEHGAAAELLAQEPAK